MRLLLVDISAVFWEAWHAGKGDGIAAYNKTMQRLQSLRCNFDLAMVCVDAGHSGRDFLHPEYKANRPPKPEAAKYQLKRAIEDSKQFRYTVARVEGFEADDVIATIVNLVSDDDKIEEVEIACCDKDICQLIGGKVYVRSLYDGKERRREHIIEKFGVPPEKLAEYLALTGDTSDNIPGCPGVGPKRAAELITKYGNVVAAITHAMLGEIDGKIGENLKAYKDQITLSRELVELNRDIKQITMEQIMQEPEKQPDPMEAEIEPAEFVEEMSEQAPTKPEPEPKPTTAVATRRHETVIVAQWERQLEPMSINEAYRIAVAARQSQAVNYPSEQAIFMAIMSGRERGLGAMTSIKGHFVFDNKLGMYTQFLIAEIHRSGLAEYFRPVFSECNDTKAVYITKRRGESVEHRFEFTIEMAQRRGLADRKIWRAQPDTMLRHRCAAELARAIYPDVAAGVYTDADLDVQPL